jgi:DnaJ-class molecular chaperone
MAHCPDCDSLKIFSDPPQGDGKCAVCHGVGFGGLVDISALPAEGDPLVCEECYGTGQCQTCRGTGTVEEREVALAA